MEYSATLVLSIKASRSEISDQIYKMRVKHGNRWYQKLSHLYIKMSIKNNQNIIDMIFASYDGYLKTNETS